MGVTLPLQTYSKRRRSVREAPHQDSAVPRHRQFGLEVKGGDPEAARERLKAVKEFPLLDITPEAERLATCILASGIIPPRSATDAAHIAVAIVHGMEFLMTCNCVHIANAGIAKAVANICRQQGFDCPTICTPEELSGE